MSNEKTQGESVARNTDYLWDRSGEPDPEVEKLEKLLGKFQHDGRALVLPQVAAARREGWFAWRNWRFPVLATAVVAVTVAAVIFLAHSSKPDAVTVAGWDVSGLAGTPRIGRSAIGTKDTNRLGVGQVLETDQQSRARLRAEDTGQIEMEPSSRLRLMSMGEGLNRIALDRGTIQVYIWAPPGQFVVDTPSATTVDLGCAYKLQVDDTGAGLVRTSLGWVGFKLNGHESFIPAGAACATRPKVGPGTPYFEDASAKFRAALQRVDFEDSTQPQRAADLTIVLDASRKRDALTLWHLLARVDEAQRARVYDRLREIAPPPAGVTKQGILRLDQPMLDQWWNKLGFDDISVWRHWERSWSGASKTVHQQ
jgi:hypothetical protein